MEEQFYQTVFIGEIEAGKTAIVNAMTRLQFELNYYATMCMTFQKTQLELQQQNVMLQICDTSGAKRNEFFVMNQCKKANVICLIIDATKKINLQMESIAYYTKELALEINRPIPLLVIANHRDQDHFILSVSDLAAVGINPNNYILLSAEQIIAEKSADKRCMLETKIAAQLVDAHPHRIPINNTKAKPRACSFWSLSSLNWFSNFFRPKKPNQSVLSFNDAVDKLSREQAQIILQKLHHHLRKGALNNNDKPYELGWFGFGGTRNGGYIISSSFFKRKAIYFESKTKYPEDIMRWLSMTMVSMNHYKMHTEDESRRINLHSILKKLFEDILNTNNSFSLKLCREKDTTLAFYNDLPRFIDEEVKRIQGIHNDGSSPLLSVNRRASQELPILSTLNANSKQTSGS